jgi:biopolymer transport protein ExbD
MLARLGQVIGVFAISVLAASAAAPARVDLRVEVDGSVDMDGTHFTNDAKLQAAMVILAAKKPRPQLLLHADNGVRFERLGHVLLLMQKTGLSMGKVGFLTEPRN